MVPALSSEGHGPGGIYTAFLNAQGRVLNDVFLYRDRSRRSSGDGSNDSKEGFLIEVDRDQAEMLAAHIKRYRLRAKFDVRVLDPEERSVWAAWDDETAPETLRDVLASSFTTDSDIIILRDDRAPGLCYRIIATGGSSAGPPSLPLSLPIVPETAYRVRRYLAGVAEGQDELVRGQALPHEHNLDVLGVVSGAPPPIDWHKGCYVGQELTIRTRHRGVVRKRVLPCVVYRYGDSQPPPAELAFFHGGSRRTGPQGGGSAESIPPQTSISRIASVSGDGSTDADRLVASGRRGGGAATTRSVGRWLAGYGNVGLALCRLEAMAPDLAQTAIHVDQPGGGASLEGTKAAEDEFVAVWEEDVRKGGETHVAGASDGQDQLQKQRHSVRVKAFVPSWLRKALRDQALAASHPGSATGGHA